MRTDGSLKIHLIAGESHEKIRLFLTCGIYLTIFILLVEHDCLTTLPVLRLSVWRGRYEYGPKSLKVVSEVHGKNWSYICWAWVLARESGNPQLYWLTLAMNTTYLFFQLWCFFMIAAVIVIISSELNWAGEKEMLFLLLPAIFIVLDCFSGNLWWVFISFCFLKFPLC